MASLNRVLIIGNLGADPEVRFTGSGQAVATLRVATNERWTDKAGQTQERTEWHSITVWGKQAEQCKEFLAKGRQIFVEGRLQTDEWNDKEGQKRYTTKIVAQRVLFLGGRGPDAGAGPRGGRGFDAPPPPEAEGGPGPADDDIPF